MSNGFDIMLWIFVFYEGCLKELKTKIACEELTKLQVNDESMSFCKLEVWQKSHRKMLADIVINEIFLYDDKVEMFFNYKRRNNNNGF